MDNQLEYYTKTGKLRNRFDKGRSIMETYATFHKGVYQDRALSLKNERPIALACGLQSGRTGCVHGETKNVIAVWATRKARWRQYP